MPVVAQMQPTGSESLGFMLEGRSTVPQLVDAWVGAARDAGEPNP